MAGAVPSRPASDGPVEAGVPTDATSLQAILAGFEEAGFTAQLAVRPGGLLFCSDCRGEHTPARTSVEALRRMEGASDPADELAVAALRCSGCGSRGTVVIPYGPEAGPDDVTVLQALTDDREGPGIVP